MTMREALYHPALTPAQVVQAHLKRNPANGKSSRTPRGRELAQQYLFARRLVQTARPDQSTKAEMG